MRVPGPASWVAPLMVAVLSITGCASSVENDARVRWRDAYEQSYPQAQSQSESLPAATLEENADLVTILALADTTNPGLRAAFDRWTAALEKAPQARGLPPLRFNYAYFLEPVETRVGPQRQKFEIAQTIPLFGKLGLGADVAGLEANAAGARYAAARLELHFRITQLWNDYYFLGRSISITEENLLLLTHLENVALSQYAAGRAPHSTVIRAQVELGRLEDRLRTMRDQRKPMLAALNAELNRPEATPIAWPDSIQIRPLAVPIDSLRAVLIRHNPELGSLAFEVDKDAAAARLAGKSPIPDLTIGAEYIDTGEIAVPVPNNGKDAVLLKASITIPLWFGQFKAEKAEAEARRSATSHEHTQRRNRLVADLERASFDLRDSERRIELYAFTLLPKARQSLEVTEDAFTAGEADFLNLVDAQRTLLEFELAYERSVADQATHRALLEKLVGVELADE